MSASSTAIVVGAGITGVATALHLAREGWSVTLLDRAAPGDLGQTSFGNAGLLARGSILPVQAPGLAWRGARMLAARDAPLFLRWSHLPRLAPWLIAFLRSGSEAGLDRIVPALWALTRDTVEAHQALAADTDAAALIETGSYGYLFRDRAEFLHEAAAYRRKTGYGLTWEEHPAGEVDPALGPAYRFAAVFPDHGWIVDPGAYVAALGRAVAAAGGALRRAEVHDIRPLADGVEVTAGGETLRADRVALCAGVWSRRLAERLGVKVPLESERGYHLMLRGASHRPPFPMMLSDRALVMTPMTGGLRVAGLVEFGGTEAGPSAAPFALIRRAIRRAYPGLAWSAEETWMGHRPTLVDSLPMLGPAPGAPGVIFAFGGQHLGLTIGARVGRLAADLVAGRPPNLDLAPYAPDRFA
jgi:D-amino-acid dehydrogenase